jgi:hypothetical protein
VAKKIRPTLERWIVLLMGIDTFQVFGLSWAITIPQDLAAERLIQSGVRTDQVSLTFFIMGMWGLISFVRWRIKKEKGWRGYQLFLSSGATFVYITMALLVLLTGKSASGVITYSLLTIVAWIKTYGMYRIQENSELKVWRKYFDSQDD